MKLSAASNYFNKTVCRDAYGGRAEVLAQLEPYDDSRRDGYSVERRILSTAPDAQLPPRRVLSIDGEAWIVGQGARDFFKNEVLRIKYLLHRAEGAIGRCFDFPTLLADIPAPIGEMYAAISWVKGLREEDSADVTDQMMIYCAESEGSLLASSTVMSFGQNLFLIRNTHQISSGFLVCEADSLDAPNVETASFGSRVYDPVSATYTVTAASIKVLRIRWRSRFVYLSQASAKFDSGDDIVIMRSVDGSPKTGDTLTLSDGDRVVVSAQTMGAYMQLHVRRR